MNSNDNGMVVNHEGSINLNNEEDFCMMAMIEDYDENSTPTENWYADSGATVHITNDWTNLFNRINIIITYIRDIKAMIRDN